MGEISVPPSASNAMDEHPVPRLGPPELMLQKIGYYHHPVFVMLCIFASPFVVLYPICRQYCDVDSCRYYRSITLYVLILFFMFIIWRAMNQKEKKNSQPISITATGQHEERAEKA